MIDMVRIETARNVHELYPTEEQLPSKDKLETLGTDDVVKMMFCDDNNQVCTKLWVKIIDRKGHYFKGRLQIEPTKIDGLKLHDTVEFKDDNIIDVWAGGFLAEEAASWLGR